MERTHPPASAVFPFVTAATASLLAAIFHAQGVGVGLLELVAGGATGWGLVTTARRMAAMRCWRAANPGPWVHHRDGSVTCTGHPRILLAGDQDAALHMAECHPEKWAALTSPGAVTQLTNRAERRAAERHYRAEATKARQAARRVS